MNNLVPVARLDNVPQIEVDTLLLGGENGPLNLPAQALLNRTEYLHDEVSVIKGANGAEVTGYTPAGPGAVPITVQQRLRQVVSVTDKGAAGTGSDDTASVQAVIAQSDSVYVPPGQYLMNQPVFNQYGTTIAGPGAIMVPVDAVDLTKGRYRLVYPETDAHQRVFGEEYLYALHRHFSDQNITLTTPKIILAGDSTIHGDYITDPTYLPQNELKSAFRRRGFDIDVVNRAVSGSVIGQWPLSTEDINTADCFVLSFGINSTSGIADFVNNFRAELQRIRLVRSYLSATIIIKTSNAVSDTVSSAGGGRDETQAHAQRRALRQIAREYQCLFFDTAAFLADTRSGATGTWDDTTNPSTPLTPGWMDDPFRTDPVYRDPHAFGNAIHPLKIGNAWIWGRLADAMLPPGAQRWATNNFINHRDVTLAAAAKINAFPQGMQMQRAQAANGFPIDGTSMTFSAPDGTGMQMLFGYGAASQIAFRQFKLSAGGEWLPWQYLTPLQGSIALQNTWAIYDVGAVAKCTLHAGLVKLSGNIKDGTITSGSVVATLPAGFWPQYVHRFAVVCGPNADQTAYLQVRADGLILIQSCPSNALLSLDDICFSAAGN